MRRVKAGGVIYAGVSLEQSSGRYLAAVYYHERRHMLGRWATAAEAAVARDRCVHYLGLDVTPNLPEISAGLGPLSPEKLRALAREQLLRNRGDTPHAFGVLYSDVTKTWSAHLAVGDRTYSVRGFASEKQAALARERMVLYYRGADRQRNSGKRKLEPASQETLRRELKVESNKRKLKPASQMTLRREREPERRTRAGKGQPGSQGIYGVYFNPKAPERPWVALVSAPGPTLRWREGSKLRTSHRRSHYLGSYESEREAAEAHDRAVLYYYDADYPYLNYPERAQTLAPADAATLASEAFRLGKQTKSSQFRGVYYAQKVRAWAASIGRKGKKRYLGKYPSEEQAARAYDRAALRAWGPKAKPNFHPKTGEPLLGLSLQQYEDKKRNA